MKHPTYLAPALGIWLLGALTGCGRAHDVTPTEHADAGGPDADDAWTCERADLEASRRFGERWSDPNACTADTDCVLVERAVACPEQDNHLGSCPDAVHASSVDAFEDLNAMVAAEICPLVTDCRSGPSCLPAEPQCVGFACRAVPQGECLTSCEALGCGECAARCAVEPSCVANAETCEAASECTPFPYSRLIWGRRYDEAAGCVEPRSVIGILDEAPTTISGDFWCGVGPDGHSYRIRSSALGTALGFAPCSGDEALTAPDC